MKSATAKLPKGQSYPLKPSRLEEALTSASLSVDVYLTRAPGRFFNAHFWPPSPDIPYERIYIQAGSVPSKEASEARDEVERKALPALITWISDILALDEKSPARRERQELKFY
ncbi:hypothetical protein PMI04_007705 [Sphingobium sp. AP49]|uniref:hypothetical protein n=1 Tax=Sphingobium sp. AP49 TaxID=1144307 RepID=UPI00068C9AE1|nr:hypothetical protein [Sphingobium sp. AP49]WHO40470.1 hypothetical protein PMI04_007705 [Sphingobium sp. AP49]